MSFVALFLLFAFLLGIAGFAFSRQVMLPPNVRYPKQGVSFDQVNLEEPLPIVDEEECSRTTAEMFIGGTFHPILEEAACVAGDESECSLPPE